jgi:hypothetical protein
VTWQLLIYLLCDLGPQFRKCDLVIVHAIEGSTWNVVIYTEENLEFAVVVCRRMVKDMVVFNLVSWKDEFLSKSFCKLAYRASDTAKSM